MFKIGDKVLCKSPGSWVDGKQGEILKLNTCSSDEIEGHLVKLDKGITVLDPCELQLIEQSTGDV